MDAAYCVTSSIFVGKSLVNPFQRVVVLLGACIVATRVSLPYVFAVEVERPHIVLLMGDDHGWEETGYNGHPYVKTPVLDEMAASGLRLNRFYAAHPSCSPTRGSVITGRHPNRYGTFAPNYSIRPEEVGIATLLKEVGYATAHFGKWHLGPVKASSPTNPGAFGFDEWLSHDNFFELNPVLSRNGAEPERIDGESSEILIDEAIRFLKTARSETRPGFVVVWFGSPHEPYSGLPEDLALYDALPESLADRRVRLTSNETGGPTRRPLREVLRERYAEITAMDRAIGRLRDALAAMGTRDNTLLWYCGDNGTPSSGAAATPLRGLKGGLYEGGIRVPGVIEWPARIESPRVTQVCSVTSDISPTLCAIAGAKAPDRPLDGIDVSGLFDGSMTRRPEPIEFWLFNRSSRGEPWIEASLQQGTTPLVKLMRGIPTRNFVNNHHPEIREADYSGARAIIDNRYKMVVRGDPETVELFDLVDDPGEQRNIAGHEEAMVERLSAELREWRTSVLNSLTGRDYSAPE